MEEEKVFYSDVKKKLKEYRKMSFSEDIQKDLAKISRKLNVYMKNYDAKWSYFNLKKVIYDTTLHLKNEVLMGYINRRLGDELKAFLWSLLLVEREEDNEI